ncbi:MAG TPA: nucleotidyltransferase family protein, partial [Nocardioides sp.]|nr:nucleotidyltransferase family protein [Nocardioides sp.]
MTPAAVSEVRRAVRAALSLESGRDPGWRWSAATDPDAFVDAVVRHRVEIPLARWAAELALPPAVTAVLTELRDDDRRTAMARIMTIRDVHELLAGIDHLLLKGTALARQTTGDPTARGSGDIDLLVAPESVGAALDRFLDAGWTGRAGSTVDRAAWSWRHQLRHGNELSLARPGAVVDLHWRLDTTRDGAPSFAALWSRRAEVDLGPVRLGTLAPPDAMRHALRHCARDGWDTLRSLVDVHRLARQADAWPAELDRLARTSLTVVDDTIGLPPGTPPFRRDRSGLPRARSLQAREPNARRWPGDQVTRYATWSLRASRTPRDVLGTAVTAL